MFTRTTQYLEVYLPSPTTVSFTVTTRRPRHQISTSTSTGPAAKTSKSVRLKLKLKQSLQFVGRNILTLTVLRHTIRILLVSYAILLNVAKAQQRYHHYDLHHHQQQQQQYGRGYYYYYHNHQGQEQSIVGRTSSAALEKYADVALQLSFGGGLVRTLAEGLEWWILGPLSLVVVYLCLRRDYGEESLLVLQGLGIQTSTSSRYFFLGATTTFIPTTQIQDIVIHEAFKGLEVRFYLAVIVEGATQVVVVFPPSDSKLQDGSLTEIEFGFYMQTLLPRRDILEEVWRGARKCLYSGIR
ncbi:hypothetical protein A1O1_04772 [Capronia coronata CBS 617.96]|uniref:Phosphatidylinositol N-acetylglucosaminyltransferase subunit H conserved domain-containing protein n=1 Tax=Capronia coronata CBS 617.96 TaxID=1182541 RepID=W9YDY0_9EURO|nr:uncharacterized protein A1O1_04772 [Capronia coronata CBS 617.96]EXJ87845.1 hypothetical protein A1O1_04772 [Capronia coronata CBS 617.96]